ncbi:LamG-like jellyroll fold domain-containing protein [Verrucomicrobiaceae bacterium 227]
MKFSQLKAGEQDWLDAYLDETISKEDFELLQERLLANPKLRKAARSYLALDHYLQSEAIETGEAGLSTPSWNSNAGPIQEQTTTFRWASLLPLAAAASVAFLLGTAVMYWSGKREISVAQTPDKSATAEPLVSPSAHGFAVIENLFDVKWESPESGRQQGDVLGAEIVKLVSGTAEIQFFSGALMTLEGPAEISLKSAWEATCRDGAVRMKVPPAARGFKLHGPTSEIEDLGTEFGLLVRNGHGKVEVFDGEISVRHMGGEGQLITKGGALDLINDGPAVAIDRGSVEVPDSSEFGERVESEDKAGFEQWQKHRDALARDKRLIAYYGFDRGAADILVPNLTLPGNTEYDGAVVMAQPVSGRWAGHKSALEFHRPGSRVRVNIPGEFPAFTLMCWVRIDSLDRQYNALFMGDGYETGEPHWQIKENGQMMLSIMVDDQRPNPKFADSKGHHRVYFSPSMWDLSMSGRWLHLTSVFDPANREVSHYVNGENISRQDIADEYFIKTLRIGNAEIGNWGQPFREDPTFAIRNLNGRMDELAIFKEALTEKEITRLFESSRSNRQ